MQLLQVSEATAALRRIFFQAVDATDGITGETGLTGVGRISKNGAATAASSGSLVEIDSTNMPGRYYIELTAAELDTVGIIEFRYKAAACAEVVARGQVVPYDPYDAVRMGLTTLPNAAAEAAGGLYTRGTGAGQINQSANGMIDTNPMRLNNVSQSLLDLVDFADAGYDPATNKVEGVKLADAVTTVNGLAAGVITAAAIATGAVDADALATDAVAEIADGVWDEAIAGHLGAGSTGLALNSAGSAGDPWNTALPGAYGAGTAGKIVGDNLNATVSSRSSHSAADVWAVATRTLTSFGTLASDVWSVATRLLTAGTNIVLAKGTGVTGFNDLSAGQVNAEVLDVMNVDTFAEPAQGAPPATATLQQKLSYLYKAWRNRFTQTATQYSLYADNATTIDQKATVGDDTVTFDRGEVASGP